VTSPVASATQIGELNGELLESAASLPDEGANPGNPARTSTLGGRRYSAVFAASTSESRRESAPSSTPVTVFCVPMMLVSS
jgi:hypothetical protein